MNLRRGVHTVQVQESKTEYVDGRKKSTLGQPTTYRVNVQPVSTAEREALGLSVDTVYRVKYWPQLHGNIPWVGGAYSRITWNGREFDQHGEALLSSMSPRTGHVKILMTARTSEVK